MYLSQRRPSSSTELSCAFPSFAANLRGTVGMTMRHSWVNDQFKSAPPPNTGVKPFYRQIVMMWEVLALPVTPSMTCCPLELSRRIDGDVLESTEITA